ncbi:MAG: hypothetical protein JSR33_07065, partial [Proteobacteria bacterium]|nr:hypothetical protein [Pseudomonadota bacterium]
MELEERILNSKVLKTIRNKYSENRCIVDLFLEELAMNPHKIAVEDESRFLSYNELAVESLEIANYLRHIGVIPDTIVGIFVEP